MFINYDDYEISRKPFKNGFEVDDLIAPAISILNKLGYRTAFCCSGHAECEYYPEHAYIEFWFGETPPEHIPEGWYWESDGNMQYEYKSFAPDALNEEIIHVMDGLSVWAEGLPDLRV